MLPVLIGCACVGALVVAAGSSSSPTPARALTESERRRQTQDDECDSCGGDPRGYSRIPTDCGPLPWLCEDVDTVLTAAWVEGQRDAYHAAITALKVVYPEDENGRPISWPSRSFDCPEAQALEHRVRVRAERVFCTLEDEQVNAEWYESGGY